MRADQRLGLELQIKLDSAPDKIGTHMLVMPSHTKGLPQQSLTHSQTLHGHFASSYKITQAHTFRMNPNFLFKNVHEHIGIVAKPPSKRANGKTVVSYDYLLGRADAPRPTRPNTKGL